MASMWRKAMLYLGLGPDEEYDDFDVTGEHPRTAPPRPAVRRTEAQHDPEPSGSVRTLPPTPGAAAPARERREPGRANGHGGPIDNGRAATVASRRSAGERPAAERPAGRGAVVRPLPTGSSKPFVVGPASFNDAQEVADKFKVNVPVIVNLQGVERDLARRIIDFSSGLCYGLGGQMERVANQVYLLTPSEVEVSPEERRRLRERGYEA
jgi:cell division inhibitor SepF